MWENDDTSTQDDKACEKDDNEEIILCRYWNRKSIVGDNIFAYAMTLDVKK